MLHLPPPGFGGGRGTRKWGSATWNSHFSNHSYLYSLDEALMLAMMMNWMMSHVMTKLGIETDHFACDAG